MNTKLLIKKRKEAGLSQKQMASLLGYKDKSSYCLIENNKVTIKLDIIKKIQQILKFTDDEFNEIFFSK